MGKDGQSTSNLIKNFNAQEKNSAGQIIDLKSDF